MPRDTRRAFLELEKKLTPRLRAAFRLSIADMVDSASTKKLTDLILLRDVDGITNELNLKKEFLEPISNELRNIFREGAEYQLSTISKNQKDVLGELVRIRFNGRHIRAENIISTQSGNLITEILDSQKKVIRDVLQDGLERSTGAQKMALRLVGRIGSNGRRSGGIISLTEPQTRYVANMREELNNLDPNYFKRKLRNKTHDRKIRRLMKEGVNLSEKEINSITEKYADRLLKSRGDTIARTETHRALNQGKSEAIDQIVDSGKINSTPIKIWNATGGSGRTRDTHASMNGQVRDKNIPFDSSSGARFMYPLDTSLDAPGEEVVNCRCTARYRIDWLAEAV